MPPGLDEAGGRAAAIATAALPLGAALSYLTIAAPRDARTIGFVVPAVTCVGASILGAFLAARARSTRRITVVAAAACGALVTVVDLVAGVHNPIFVNGWFALFALANAVGGAILGAALGVTASMVVGRLEDAREAPSLDGADRVQIAAAVWLGSGATMAWMWRDAPLVRAGAAVVMALSIAALVVVLARDTRRLIWLDAVMSGRLPGWSIVADGERGAAGSALPRFVGYEDGALDGYVVCDEGAGRRWIAEIPRERAGARAPIVRRIVIVGVAVAGAGISLAGVLRGLLHG